MSNALPQLFQLALDLNGDPISGSKLNFYAKGTTTRLDTYSDEPLTTAHANPVVADSAGRFAPIWLAASDYKVIWTDADDVTITTFPTVHGTIDVTGDAYAPSQQSTPDMTVLLAAGSLFNTISKALVTNAAQTSAVITAPSSNPRKDIIYIDRLTGAVGVTTGSEGASPSDPTLTADKLPVARVTLATTTTEITDSLIDDIRHLGLLGSPYYVDEDDMASDSASRAPSQQSVKAYVDASTPRGFIDGLILSNNSGDAAKDLDIAAGAARDGGDAANMVLAASITKQLDGAWAVGTDAGALDGTESVGGTPDASTWYHIWLIRRSDTGVVDVLASESATGPTMPTNYDQKRRIGAVLFDATPDILAFHQHGNEFYWVVRIEDENDTTPGNSAVTPTMSVPLGIVVMCIFVAVLNDSEAATVIFTSPSETDTTPTTSINDMRVASGGPIAGGEFRRKTNTSSQIRYHFDNANTMSIWLIHTIGWVDPRGRNG